MSIQAGSVISECSAETGDCRIRHCMLPRKGWATPLSAMPALVRIYLTGPVEVKGLQSRLDGHNAAVINLGVDFLDAYRRWAGDIRETPTGEAGISTPVNWSSGENTVIQAASEHVREQFPAGRNSLRPVTGAITKTAREH